MDRTHARVWVDGTSVDVQVILSKNLRSLVDSSARSIEDTTQHVLRNTKLQTGSFELDF